MITSIDSFMRELVANNPGEDEFHQAVEEVLVSLWPILEENPRYLKARVFERMVEPERTIIFRVPWVNDQGEIRVNRGFRVEMNSSIGPYKGGLRFHPSVNLSIMKFLAFEQTFKNSLTTLPIGSGKGGSDFDPKGKSDGEVMRFCQAFMQELFRHIGHNTDIPAGDIGVGNREIGYLFGMYKKLANEFTGVLTGKRRNWGGSLIRPEATGYGVVYFAEEMFKLADGDLAGKRVLISGAGNVAQYAAEKAIDMGAKVVTMSDSRGLLVLEDGLTREQLDCVMCLKNEARGQLRDFLEHYPDADYREGERPWHVPGDVALPCATQNELNGDEARALVENGIKCLAEGANMPCTPEAIDVLQDSHILYAPGKAANAGGVAVSALEMAQNSMRISWDRQEVDQRLRQIMCNIHHACLRHGKNDDESEIDYLKGANIAGFIKVADSMLELGVV